MELRNVEEELQRFRGRVMVAAVVVLVAFGLLVWRMVHLQVVRHDELATQAESNRIAVVPVVPNRGSIVDRNGVVLATNYAAYTLEVSPRMPARDLEALIDALSGVVEVTARDRKRFRRLQDEMKGADSLPIRTKLTDEEVARFLVQRFRFPGAELKARLFRTYPLGETASHLLGYIGRINQAETDAMDEWPEEQQANYKGTDYIGKLGVEQSYESLLHGQTGFDEVETSAGGHAVRRLNSHPATPGRKLVLSIDVRLQALVEQLFGERRGALVAIDPRNGEVLAFVSKPTFDPNLFVDGIDSESWRELNESIDKPLLNRALRGTYPPGSTFKPFMAMAALTSGVRGPDAIIYDGGSFVFGGHVFRSHGDHGLGAVDMTRSIVKSSNVYYYSLANELGVDRMHELLTPWGFGIRSGIDLESEVSGVLPSTEWKKRYYRKPEQQKWYAGETISLGIGQGYNAFTMLQLANATAMLANNGQRYEPRLVRQVVDEHGGQPVVQKSGAAIAGPKIDPQHTEIVRQAMYGVTQEGTSTRVFLGAPYRTGGKTGTAQAVTIRQNERYNASKLEEHKRDHSLYIAFAPLEAPTVALAIVVENAGFGAAAAAPIARRVFDYLLLGQYPSVEDVALTQQGKSAAPVGTPRAVADVPLLPVFGSAQAQADAEALANAARPGAAAAPGAGARPPATPGSGPRLRAAPTLPIGATAASPAPPTGVSGSAAPSTPAMIPTQGAPVPPPSKPSSSVTGSAAPAPIASPIPAAATPSLPAPATPRSTTAR